MRDRLLHYWLVFVLAPLLLSPQLALGVTWDTPGIYLNAYTVPANVTSITIEAWGSGGTGGIGIGAQGGGGGGAYCGATLTVSPGNQYTVTVGALGSSSLVVGPGLVDLSPPFGNWFIADGGSAGGNNGGAGGSISTCLLSGATRHAGGSGGNRAGSSGGGGGGGGSATATADGGNGSNGSGNTGGGGGSGQGNGGNGGTASNGQRSGVAGIQPGGGGGGKASASGLNIGTSALGAPGLVIIKANQTIIFGTPPTVVVGGTGTVSATGGGSGNPVTFSTASTDCSVNPSTGVVTGINAGTNNCVIAADQAGNSDYNAATQVTQTFSIGQASTTTTITSDTPDPSVPNQQVLVSGTIVVNAPGSGSLTGGNIHVSPSASSCDATIAADGSWSCTLPGSDFPSIGNYTITATYAGDTNFSGSSDTEPHQVVAAPLPASASPIPTLQEWALMLMGLLLGGLVWHRSQRKNDMSA